MMSGEDGHNHSKMQEISFPCLKWYRRRGYLFVIVSCLPQPYYIMIDTVMFALGRAYNSYPEPTVLEKNIVVTIIMQLFKNKY